MTMNVRELTIASRKIGDAYAPFVIPEIGINHGGDIERAIQMIDDVADAGGECVKFQSHSVDDEMIPNNVIPANSTRSIWDIMEQCTLSEAEELACKKHAEDRGLIFLSTPFSREAANRLDALATSVGNIINHLNSAHNVTAMIDANFGNHKRCICITNLARCDCQFADVHSHGLILT